MDRDAPVALPLPVGCGGGSANAIFLGLATDYGTLGRAHRGFAIGFRGDAICGMALLVSEPGLEDAILSFVEIVKDESSGTLFDFEVAIPIWLLALLLPLRVIKGKIEFGWDIVGYLGTAVFGYVIVVSIEEPFLDWLEPSLGTWYASSDRLPPWGSLLLYVLLSDFASYWAHRLLHTRVLWDGHAWHHSPSYLYFMSGSRAAPLHIFVLIAPTTFAYLLFPYPDAHYYAVAHAIFQTANQHYIHTNVWVPYAKQLEYLFVTPRFHFVHHSSRRAYSDSNYGFIFSFWDRLFGTYTDPHLVPADEPLGLNYEIGKWRLLFGLPPKKATMRETRPADSPS